MRSWKGGFGRLSADADLARIMVSRRGADDQDQRRIELVESSDIPRLDIVFGFGPTLPFICGVAIAGLGAEPWRVIALQLTALWGSAILLFLSGVRRGLSFRTEGGPTLAQMLTMLALFGLGLGSLGSLWLDALLPAFALLLAGYAMIFVLDPIAARRGEAPLYFRRLRRIQIPIILLTLALAAAIAAKA
jgi:hypothetical protein